MKTLENLLRVIEEILKRQDFTLTDELKTILLKNANSLTNEEGGKAVSLRLDLINGLLKCAAEGFLFSDESNIKKKMGRTIEENYAGASQSFLKFAKTYWTFSHIVDEDFIEVREVTLYQLLKKCKTDIQGLFFPTVRTDGELMKKRKEAQIGLIKSSGANINLDDFIKGNPFLQ